MAENHPTVWVVVLNRFGSDLAGIAVCDDGEVMGSHVSSNEVWLRHDLTERADRRALLTAKYPDGFEVRVGQPDDLTMAKAGYLPAKLDMNAACELARQAGWTDDEIATYRQEHVGAPS